MNYTTRFCNIRPSLIGLLRSCKTIRGNSTMFIFSQPCSVNHFCKSNDKRHLFNIAKFSKQIIEVNARAHGTSSKALPHYKTVNHCGTWISERFFSFMLIGLIPYTFTNPSPNVECITCVTVFAHLYWGLEAICTDYLRPSVVGKLIPKFIPAIVLVPLFIVLYGFLHVLITQQGSVTNLIKQLWFLRTTDELKNA